MRTYMLGGEVRAPLTRLDADRPITYSQFRAPTDIGAVPLQIGHDNPEVIAIAHIWQHKDGIMWRATVPDSQLARNAKGTHISPSGPVTGLRTTPVRAYVDREDIEHLALVREGAFGGLSTITVAEPIPDDESWFDNHVGGLKSRSEDVTVRHILAGIEKRRAHEKPSRWRTPARARRAPTDEGILHRPGNTLPAKGNGKSQRILQIWRPGGPSYPQGEGILYRDHTAFDDGDGILCRDQTAFAA